MARRSKTLLIISLTKTFKKTPAEYFFCKAAGETGRSVVTIAVCASRREKKGTNNHNCFWRLKPIMVNGEGDGEEKSVYTVFS